MPKPIVGLHHVTAIASDPQRNLDFYTEVLGLRFVKRTINFDDPGTYHFYFGDDAGSPGTILTFFPWPRATRGSLGVGETSATAFSVPRASLEFWEGRLLAAGIPPSAVAERVFEAVRDEKLYILTHPETKPLLQRHMEDVIAERNPDLTAGIVSESVAGAPR